MNIELIYSGSGVGEKKTLGIGLDFKIKFNEITSEEINIIINLVNELLLNDNEFDITREQAMYFFFTNEGRLFLGILQKSILGHLLHILAKNDNQEIIEGEYNGIFDVLDPKTGISLDTLLKLQDYSNSSETCDGYSKVVIRI